MPGRDEWGMTPSHDQSQWDSGCDPIGHRCLRASLILERAGSHARMDRLAGAADPVPRRRVGSPGRRARWGGSLSWLTHAVIGCLGWLTPVAGDLALVRAGEPQNFSRDILPLLADRCFACHGPDESHRQADLRLDSREAATARRDAGAAIIPGDAGGSELLRRISSHDPAEQMPPPGGGRKPLSGEEVARLTQWVREGAPWGRHWAFEPITRPNVPVVVGTPVESDQKSNPARMMQEEQHPVDAFLGARLRGVGSSLSPPAALRTQLRRLSFDLTGLPPSREELERFVGDPSPEAWDREVERLLASPRFGERMAMWWLDAARYADTDGFQADATRQNWPWRDWVVRSFNGGMDYATFTREQFAGDLLPEPTVEQRLATAFHRNHMTNGEGGRDPEESRVDYVIDRVNTMGTVWLGLTLGCCQCHSHKFDPVSHNEYYALAAFFDSIDEDGRAGGGAHPFLAYRSDLVEPLLVGARQLLATRQAHLSRARVEAEPQFEEWVRGLLRENRAATPSWIPWRPSGLLSVEGTTLKSDREGRIVATGAHPRQDDYRLLGAVPLSRVTGLRLRVYPDPDLPGPGFSRGASGEFILTDVKLQVRQSGESQEQELPLASATADFSADKKINNNYGDIADTLDDDPRNGWSTVGAGSIEPHEAVFALAQPWTPQPGEELVVELRQRSTQGDRNLARFAVWLTDEVGPTLRQVGPTPREELAEYGAGSIAGIPDDLRGRLREQFLAADLTVEQARLAVDRAARQLTEWEVATRPVNVMVLAERGQRRTTHVLRRGVWDQKGEVVERGVPAAVGVWPAGVPDDRLGLANWLMSRSNPLPARVAVNHVWQLLWGEGLVRTPEDFGVQGEFPTHPELLDWLASELLSRDWDLRHVIRLVVTSRAYRQSSRQEAAHRETDPGNRLWGRQSRYRRPAWMLRDAALQVAGLLEPTVGGPPVRPHQPEGIWEENFMGRFRYEPSEGSAQFRRTLYAFWRRAIAPTFLFDSAQRRVCEVRVARTNTPLQALVLWNDENFLLAARGLAVRMSRVPGGREAELRWLLSEVLSRPAEEEEVRRLVARLREAEQWYADHRPAADELLRTPLWSPPEDVDRAAVAARVVLASLVLNLDEAISHE